MSKYTKPCTYCGSLMTIAWEDDRFKQFECAVCGRGCQLRKRSRPPAAETKKPAAPRNGASWLTMTDPSDREADADDDTTPPPAPSNRVATGDTLSPERGEAMPADVTQTPLAYGEGQGVRSKQMKLPGRKCAICGADISQKRSHAKTCSDACRTKYNNRVPKLREDAADALAALKRVAEAGQWEDMREASNEQLRALVNVATSAILENHFLTHPERRPKA